MASKDFPLRQFMTPTPPPPNIPNEDEEEFNWFNSMKNDQRGGLMGGFEWIDLDAQENAPPYVGRANPEWGIMQGGVFNPNAPLNMRGHHMDNARNYIQENLSNVYDTGFMDTVRRTPVDVIDRGEGDVGYYSPGPNGVGRVGLPLNTHTGPDALNTLLHEYGHAYDYQTERMSDQGEFRATVDELYRNGVLGGTDKKYYKDYYEGRGHMVPGEADYVHIFQRPIEQRQSLASISPALQQFYKGALK